MHIALPSAEGRSKSGDMEKIKINLEKYKVKQKAAKFEWQDRVLDMLDYLDCPPKLQGCVFKMVRNNRSKAEAAFDYMSQKKITSVFYFFKLMSL